MAQLTRNMGMIGDGYRRDVAIFELCHEITVFVVYRIRGAAWPQIDIEVVGQHQDDHQQQQAWQPAKTTATLRPPGAVGSRLRRPVGAVGLPARWTIVTIAQRIRGGSGGLTLTALLL